MIEVSILTPNGLYKKANVSQINVVSKEGPRCILPRHMPIVVAIVVSALSLDINNERQYYAISGGTLFMHDNICTILTPAIENVKEIDIERALRAKKRAQERLDAHQADVDIKRAKTALSKALNRLRVSDFKNK